MSVPQINNGNPPAQQQMRIDRAVAQLSSGEKLWLIYLPALCQGKKPSVVAQELFDHTQRQIQESIRRTEDPAFIDKLLADDW
jgi:hypothetical protein